MTSFWLLDIGSIQTALVHLGTKVAVFDTSFVLLPERTLVQVPKAPRKEMPSPKVTGWAECNSVEGHLNGRTETRALHNVHNDRLIFHIFRYLLQVLSCVGDSPHVQWWMQVYSAFAWGFAHIKWRFWLKQFPPSTAREMFFELQKWLNNCAILCCSGIGNIDSMALRSAIKSGFHARWRRQRWWQRWSERWWQGESCCVFLTVDQWEV